MTFLTNFVAQSGESGYAPTEYSNMFTINAIEQRNKVKPELICLTDFIKTEMT